MNIPGVERPATEVALVAVANLSTAGQPGLLEATTLTRALSGNCGSSCPQRLFSVLLDAGCNAVAPPLADDCSACLEVRVGATELGSRCKESEDSLQLHQGPAPGQSPFTFRWRQNKAVRTSLGAVRKGEIIDS